MEALAEERNTEGLSPEAARCQAEARKHLRQLREFWIIFLTTGVVILAILALAIQGGLGWFVSNTRVDQSGLQISAAGTVDFALATVGRKEQGVYDRLFGLTSGLPTQTIGGTTYCIGAGKGSLRLNSDQNLNNYLDNADLRPGNRGNFDLYVICRGENRVVTLQPVFSAWYEADPAGPSYANAFSGDAPAAKKSAATFLTGHFLLFAYMDEKGMYSGSIDVTQPVTLDLAAGEATQGERSFRWGEQVEDTPVYRLRVYWVWAEQFGNFVYTGNSYQKNLFADTKSDDYALLLRGMNDHTCRKFFQIPVNETRPAAEINNRISTQLYELYSGWYDAADEVIGTEISYLELGFALVPDSGE